MNRGAKQYKAPILMQDGRVLMSLAFGTFLLQEQVSPGRMIGADASPYRDRAENPVNPQTNRL